VTAYQRHLQPPNHGSSANRTFTDRRASQVMTGSQGASYFLYNGQRGDWPVITIASKFSGRFEVLDIDAGLTTRY